MFVCFVCTYVGRRCCCDLLSDDDTREGFHRSLSSYYAVGDVSSMSTRDNSAVAQPAVDRCRTSSSVVAPPVADVTVVGYYVGDEPIPYRTTVAGARVTLAQFKRLLSKRGDFR
jgi:hypothetical protein